MAKHATHYVVLAAWDGPYTRGDVIAAEDVPGDLAGQVENATIRPATAEERALGRVALPPSEADTAEAKANKALQAHIDAARAANPQKGAAPGVSAPPAAPVKEAPANG